MIPSLFPTPVPSHPRLLAGEADWLRLRRQVRTDAVSATIFAELRSKAEKWLTAPPLERVMDGYRLLGTSRSALERICALALVFQVTEDTRFAQRAIEELRAVTTFSDWNPSHYLDTAEMALAVALGFDWLYDHLDADDRTQITTALLEKGILPSTREPKQWFLTGNNNWNQVCHAGMAAAAIAIADVEPSIAEEILRRSIDNLHYSASAYAPDGAYPEGPTYWNYGTSFHVILAAALERLTGSTQGVDNYPGFAATADYITQVTTPSGRFYSYADGTPFRPLLIPLFWFARRFQRPDWLSIDLSTLNERMKGPSAIESNRLIPLALLWRDPELTPAPEVSPARHWLGNGPMPVATHRSSFSDSEALYVAIKGGSPSLNHAHMDVGSFVLEWGGIPWAVDLGYQGYESLESIGVNLWDASEQGMRWNIFRFGPEAHNILRFDNGRQALQANAAFISFQAEGDRPFSVLNLSEIYRDQVQSVQRGIRMIEDAAVLIQDEWLAGDNEVEVCWQMLTPAEVSISSRELYLSKDGKKLRLQILDSAEVVVETQDGATLLQPFDAPNPGLSRITVKTRTAAGEKGTLRVLATPQGEAEIATPKFEELSSWGSVRSL